MTVLDPQAGPRMESRVAQYGLNGNPGDGDHVDVSIVMPCLNEEEAIRGCIDEARASLTTMGLAGEILVVDNGSTDGSAQVALDAGARVIHEPDRGYGNACRRGLQEARGRYVVLGDADGTYDFSALPSFVEPLYNGSDMVMGSRLRGTIDKGAMPLLHRYIGNPFLTGVMNVLFSNDISDLFVSADDSSAGQVITAQEESPYTPPDFEEIDVPGWLQPLEPLAQLPLWGQAAVLSAGVAGSFVVPMVFKWVWNLGDDREKNRTNGKHQST